MGILIELTPEVEAALLVKAAREGEPLARYAARMLTDTVYSPATPQPEARTLAQMLAGRTGRIDSDGSRLARNAELDGKKFWHIGTWAAGMVLATITASMASMEGAITLMTAGAAEGSQLPCCGAVTVAYAYGLAVTAAVVVAGPVELLN